MMDAEYHRNLSALRRREAKEKEICVDCKKSLDRKGARCLSCNKKHRDRYLLKSLSVEIEERMVYEYRFQQLKDAGLLDPS